MKKEKLLPNSPVKTMARLFSYFQFHKLAFVGGLLMIVLSTVAQIAANGMLSPIIDTIIETRQISSIRWYLLIMIGLVAAIILFQYFGNLAMARIAQQIIHQLREELFEKIQTLPIAFHDKHGHGRLMSTFTNDMDILNQSLEQSVAQIVISIVTVIGTLGMMIYLSPLLTVVVVVTLAMMIFIARAIAQKSGRFFRQRQESTAELNRYVEEMIDAQKIVKVFNYENHAIAEFNEQAEILRENSTTASAYGVMMMPVMGNLSYFQYALLAVTGGIFVIQGRLSVGNIASFLQFTRTISRPITQVSNQMNAILAAIAGAERIFRLLDEDPEDLDDLIHLEEGCDGKKDLCWVVPTDNGEQRIPVKGDIRFHNVDFGYTKGQKVLKDISLFAKPGQKIAFVGSTGAGKTTITNLINRFYEIDGGKITFDGIDISQINKYDVRSIMSVVLQDVHLFEGTIAYNIRYGRLDATDEEVVQAAKRANAHDFIMQLKDGYNTYITDDGGSLSQGERQLLSIARAAIADPVVLILDEATSSVDTRTEALIEDGMDELMKGRTTFVIAHRLSTVRRSDAIIVLEQGEIVERGDHDDLMQLKGRYYDLNVGTAELD